MIQDLIGSAKEISRESREMGVSAVFYQQLSISAQKAGRDIGTVEGAFARMQNTIADAATKGGAAAEVFTKLHLKPEDLLGQNAESQFRAVAGAVNAIGNETLRTQAEMDVFGRSGKQLEEVLRQVADGTADKFEVMSARTVNALKMLSGAGNDLWQRFKVAEADGLAAFTEFMELTQYMSEGMTWMQAEAALMRDLTDAIKEHAEATNADAEAAQASAAAARDRAAVGKAAQSQRSFENQTEAMGAPGEIAAAMRQIREQVEALREAAGGKAELTGALGKEAIALYDALDKRCAALNQQKIDDARFAANVAGMSAPDRDRARLVHEGFDPKTADVVASLEKQARAAEKAQAAVARYQEQARTSVKVLSDELRRIADLAASGKLTPSVAESARHTAYEEALRQAGLSDAMKATPKQAYENEMATIETLRALGAPKDLLDRATAEAKKQLDASKGQEGRPNWSESMEKGSKEAFESIMAGIAAGQQSDDQKAIREATENTAAASQRAADTLASIAGRSGDEGDVEDLAGAART